MLTARQVVELFHLLFLEQLSYKLDKKLYCLKGGCNLRFFLKSIRYSEDIDLDVHTIAPATLENKITRILQGATLKQVLATRDISITQISTPKQTETTQRWKLLLKVPHISLPLPTKIEFSRRKTEHATNLGTIDKEIIRHYHITPVFLNHYSAEDAFLQKVYAIILRSETQARDIFDLYHLSHYISINNIARQSHTDIETAKSNVLSINFNAFKSQVVAYLPLDNQAAYQEKSIWDNMVLAVLEMLDELCD